MRGYRDLPGWLLVLSLSLWLTACGTRPSASESRSTTSSSGTRPSASATVALTPTASSTVTQQPSPTPTPTSTPTATPGPLAQAGGPITIDSVAQLQPLYRLGRPAPEVMAWSPDGQVLAVGHRGGVQLLDGHTLEELALLETGGTDGLRFSPDGHWLVEGSSQRLTFGEAEQDWLTVWNVSSHTQLTRIDLNFNAFSFLFLPDSSLLVTGITTRLSGGFITGFQVHVQRFDPQTGRSLAHTTYQPPGDMFGTSWLVEDGQKVFVKGDQAFYWLDAASGQLLNRMATTVNASQSVATGTLLAYTDRDLTPRQVALINVASGETLHTWDLDEAVEDLAFTGKQDTWLCVQTRSEHLCRDVATWDMVDRWTLDVNGFLLPNPVDGRMAQFTGQTLTLLGPDDQVLASVEDVFPLNGRVWFSPDGSLMAVVNSPPYPAFWLDLWDTASLQRRAHLLLNPTIAPDLVQAAFGGGFLFVVDGDRPVLSVIDLSSGEVQNEVPVPDDAALALAVSADGSQVLVGTNLGMYRVSWPDGQVQEIMPGMEDLLAWDERSQVVVMSDGWNLVSGLLDEVSGEFAPLDFREGAASAVQPLGDGSWVFLDALGMLHLMQISAVPDEIGAKQTPPDLVRLEDCEQLYQAEMAVAPGGRLVALSCDSAVLHLIDAGTGRLLRDLELPDRVSGVAFSPDGRLLVTTSLYGELTFWSVP